MTSLLNLTIVARHAVPPPYYGFYDATWWEAHKPSLAAKVAAAMPGTPIDPAKAPTHTTFVLHVAGSSSAPFDGLRLRTDLYVRGAMWRSYGHALCVSLVDPEDELDHACAKGGGVFDAKVWLFVPGNARPAVSIEHVLRARWPGAAAVRKPTLPSLGSATWHDMPTFAKRLHDVCAWTAPMLAESGSAFAEGGLAALIRKECAKVASASVDGGAAAAGRTLGDGQLHSLVGLADVLNEVAWKHARKSKVVMQVKGEDLQAVGAAFLLAASSLPQPFAIVESGNLCGGSTTLLALLRRRFCPSCPFYSVDPGWFRPVMGHPHSCARDTLAWAGLSAEVNFHDGPGASLTSLESPVGFVYLDDGKARYFNEPLYSYLRPKLMRGAIVAMDDGWHEELLPHSRRYYGQVAYAAELVDAGECQPLVVPSGPRIRFDNNSTSNKVRYGLGYSMPEKSQAEVSKETARMYALVGQARFAAVRMRWAHPSMTVVLSCDGVGVGPSGDQVRVAVVDRASGMEHAHAWVELPLTA